MAASPDLDHAFIGNGRAAVQPELFQSRAELGYGFDAVVVETLRTPGALVPLWLPLSGLRSHIHDNNPHELWEIRASQREAGHTP